MSPKSVIEVADQKSRLRAILFAVATLVFIAVQFLTHPVFDNEPYAHGWRQYAWLLNIVLLLACLGGGGGIFNPRQLRELINDDVARSNYRAACKIGFWLAMLAGLVLYSVPPFQSLSGRQVSYLVVSIAASAALLVFAWLEYRAHADA